MLVFFLLGKPALNDDGFQYEGFAESLARGHLDFKSYYGFQGLSFFASVVFLITHSHISVILTSMIFVLLSIPLAFLCGQALYKSEKAGIYFMILFLLMPYPYVTLMRGFQEAALAFFILLTIYGGWLKKSWTPLAWAAGAIVKPFTLVLFPLFISDFLTAKKLKWLILGLVLGGVYLAANYYQTGHLVNNAAINSYQGNFSTGNPPPLGQSFTLGLRGFGRTLANLLVASRKILASPAVVIIGAYELWRNRKNIFYRRLIWASAFNLLLVSLLTFSFAKYLLPAVIILNLASIPFLLRHRWLMYLVFADALTVFLPIWRYFGKVFWTSFPLFMLPFWTVVVIYLIYEFSRRYSYTYSDSKRER